jgi:hypothetical protein
MIRYDGLAEGLTSGLINQNSYSIENFKGMMVFCRLDTCQLKRFDCIVVLPSSCLKGWQGTQNIPASGKRPLPLPDYHHPLLTYPQTDLPIPYYLPSYRSKRETGPVMDLLRRPCRLSIC